MSLAIAIRATGEQTEAQTLLEKCEASQAKVLEKEHPDLNKTRAMLMVGLLAGLQDFGAEEEEPEVT